MKKMVLLALMVMALLLMTSLVSARGYLPGVDAPLPDRHPSTLTGIWIPYFSWGWAPFFGYGPNAVPMGYTFEGD